jgi:alpha-L-fucosidase
LFSLIDAASKNGNMLLNIGPRGDDAQIPPEQLKRLREMGEWLRPNRAALYGTRPWTRAEAVTTTGDAVRITESGRTLNLIVCGRPSGVELRIKDLAVSGQARLLTDGSPITLTQSGADLILGFGKALTGELAPVISITRG